MTREELKDSIQLALIENIPGGKSGPDDSSIMKANTAMYKIMAAVDRYLSTRG